jgi:hypothetical protein
MTGTAEATCTVCGETVQASNSAFCNGCGQRFHLNLRTDKEGKDCGDVWIDEQSLSLCFACFNCLRGEATATERGEPPVGERH